MLYIPPAFRETDPVDDPVSPYAASKKASELMAYTFHHLRGLPVTGLRFFTAYGPWGRPDMALFRFTAAILEGRPVEIYNHGQMRRDFTYIDDLVEGIVRLIAAVPAAGEAGASPVAPWRVVNIGNGAPVGLMDFVAAVEAATGLVAEKRLLPMQPGDVPATWADTGLIEALTGPLPRTDLREGVQRFVDWYRGYFGA